MLINNGNDVVSFPLVYSRLPSAADFVQDYDLSSDNAIRAREDIEVAYLSGFFARVVPPNDAAQPDWIEHHFRARGFSAYSIGEALRRYNSGELDNHPQRALQAAIDRGEDPPVAQAGQTSSNLQAFDLGETVADDASEHSWHAEGANNDETRKEGQSLLNLLYHIAEDKARRDGYVHRGVTCNSCNEMPIRGIRYRCANCVDHDLCEQCEASQSHPRTHLFYKIRIPAHFLGHRQPQPVWYPGKPFAVAPHLPRDVGLRLSKETQKEVAEIDALWDQFRCLAASDWNEDPNEFHLAIDRRTFDRCFVPTGGVRTPPPNLLYDRMFAFYDTNGDGLIGFEEFVKGLASLNSRNKEERIKRIFQGYDIDRDGYVCRRDFLRMFRAYYTLSKEVTRDWVAGSEEEFVQGRNARDVITSGQPISSAFSGMTPSYQRRRTRAGKILNATGDLVIADDRGVLDDSDHDEGDQNEVVGDAAEAAVFGAVSNKEHNFWESMLPPSDEEDDDDVESTPWLRTDVVASRNEELQFEESETTAIPTPATPGGTASRVVGWPPDFVTIPDVESALGSYIAIEDIRNFSDRDHVCRTARKRLQEEDIKQRQVMRQRGIDERWHRKNFYIDEENGIEAPKDAAKDEKPARSNGKSCMDHAKTQQKVVLEKILNSRLAKSFQVSIEDEILERRFVSEGNPVGAASAVVEVFITMIEEEHSSVSMAEELSTGLNGLLEVAPSFADANNFVEWLLRYIRLTEKEMTKVSGEPQTGSTPLSRRSRSSSKVRFEDDLTDGELETRSNTSMSSRSIAVGERWGGFEVPQPEKDVGHEVLYQVTQEGLNEMLNFLFKQREDLAMEVLRTKAERAKWRSYMSNRIDQATKTKLEGKIELFQKYWRLLPTVNMGPPITNPFPTLQEEFFEWLDCCYYPQRSSDTSEDQEEPSLIEPSNVALMLHEAVQMFSTAEANIERAANRPLDELLQESGYTAGPSPSTTLEPDNTPSSSVEHRDPTLPQFRPNSVTNPEPTPTKSSNKKSTPISRLAALSRPSTTNAILDPPPSTERTKYLVMLDYIEMKDDGERGGPGRLSYEEFLEIMDGPRGIELGFLGNWIEMASF